MKRSLMCFISVIMLVSVAGAAELVWMPINPSFGGSPLNASWLLSSANAQNKILPEIEEVIDDPVEDFKERIDRLNFNQLAEDISKEVFGENAIEWGDSDLVNYEFGKYNVSLEQFPLFMKITVSPKSDPDIKSVFEMSYF